MLPSVSLPAYRTSHSGESEPVGAVHSVWSTLVVPGDTHALHSVCPGTSWYFPAAHVSHTFVAALNEVPAVQYLERVTLNFSVKKSGLS